MGASVAVLSYPYWQSRFGGRPTCWASHSPSASCSYTIIGVTPPGFEGASDGRAPIAFMPLTTFAASVAPDFYRDYGWSWLDVIVRRKPVTPANTSADLTNAYGKSSGGGA